MNSVYLARQPIVSLDESLEAYEVMYQDLSEGSTEHDFSSSASVINSILNEHKAFIKVDAKFLMSDLILNISHDTFILSLLKDIEFDEKTIERVEKLYAQGFCIAVDDRDLNEDNILEYADIIDKLEYFKINIYTTIGESEKELLVFLQKQNIKIVATQIENIEEYQTAKNLGCDLYQGYWFSKSEVLESATFNPTQIEILSLYNILISDEGNDIISLEFEKNSDLTGAFLKFINSANLYDNEEISSITQILTLVDRKSLASWFLLMIYTHFTGENIKTSPLLLMVKGRTALMQNLLKALKPNVNKNALAEAYLIGVVSLLDTVLKVKLSDILEYINISEISKQALLQHGGALGKIYKLVCDIEDYNVSEIVTFSRSYKVKEEDIQEVILKSIKDVNAFETSLNAPSNLE